jgi:hypothetical protein
VYLGVYLKVLLELVITLLQSSLLWDLHPAYLGTWDLRQEDSHLECHWYLKAWDLPMDYLPLD